MATRNPPPTPDPAAADRDAFAEACRRGGLADTPQRRLIYAALADSHDHPTAEALHVRVKQRLPKVSLATVYRNLKAFSEIGLVDEVATGSSFARYDANKRPHHHLICNACGGVSDYYSDRLAELEPSGGDFGDFGDFEVHEAKVNLYGLCAQCRRAQRKR